MSVFAVLHKRLQESKEDWCDEGTQTKRPRKATVDGDCGVALVADEGVGVCADADVDGDVDSYGKSYRGHLQPTVPSHRT
jgi:hypothetical protein